jgi:hypothetical protein
VKKSQRVGVLGCKGTILVEFSAIRNKNQSAKGKEVQKKNKRKKSRTPKEKENRQQRKKIQKCLHPFVVLW